MASVNEEQLTVLGLGDIAKDFPNKESAVYTESYDILVAALKSNKKLRGLMSQVVVPGLIKKMGSLKTPEMLTSAELKDALVAADPKEDNINQNYPYPQTQIIDIFVGIRDETTTLSGILSDSTKFRDPLLVTAVTIVKDMAGDEVNYEDAGWVKKISKAVNLIQDLIVRNIILAEIHVVPLVADQSIPDEETAGKLLPNVKAKRALGLGENPNPEMASILNPGLVMTEEKQKQYHRVLEMLSGLISPEEDSSLKMLRHAFLNAEFKVSEEDLPPIGGGDDVPEGEEEEDEIEDEDEEEDEREATTNLKLQIKTLKAQVSRLKIKKEVDYNLKALEYLIVYLGLDAKIPPLVAKWFELDALTTKSDEIHATINIKLSNLIQGNEKLTIRRKNETGDDYETPTDEDIEAIVKPLDHKAIIAIWRKMLSKEKAEAKPTKGDLIYVEAEIDAAEAEEISQQLEEDIITAKELATNITSSIISTTMNYTKKLNSNRRRKKNQRDVDERVLVW